MALKDEDVDKEMNKMVAFIKQEALEKAREIKVKADEEFNIEKAKLVRQETLAIDALYQKKQKQAEIQKKIALSTQLNKSRLQILQNRQELLSSLFSEARERLKESTKDKAAYKTLLTDLLLQGFYRLLEPTVEVSCKKSDEDLVKEAIAAAIVTYKKKTGLNLETTINSNFLSEKLAGGIVLSARNGKIKCSNTLETRLELLCEQMLPDIRIMLFGASPNRRFYN